MKGALNSETTRNLGRTLSWTAGLCFIGHGAWGVITKADWIPFFGVFGIPAPLAWKLMPFTGAFDIAVGLSMFIRPFWGTIAWMALWTVATAFLRPLSGLSAWEVVERGGNFGPPIALLVLFAATSARPLSVLSFATTKKRLAAAKLILTLSLALLLLGHGAFQFFLNKPLLIKHWTALGVPNPPQFSIAAGSFEILLAFLVLASPSRRLLTFLLAWKLGTELLYPIAGRNLDVFEFIERWGDYGIPIALMIIERLQGAQALPDNATVPALSAPCLRQIS